MKKLIKTFLAIILILTVVLLTKKEEPKSANEYYRTTTGLNVRTGIGNKNPISFVLQKGDLVEIIAKKRGWYKIKYEDKIGYAHPKFLLKQDADISNIESVDLSLIKKLLLIVSLAVFLFLAIRFSLILFKRLKDNNLLKTVTDPKRGTASERDLVLRLLRYGIQNDHIFHDLSIEIGNDKFSQIDVIAVIDTGIIVFEVKDYSGWIYGNGDKPEWTQVLAYGKQKYRFQNPIIQNRNHIRNLMNELSVHRNIPIYSVIIFYGNCVLKNINFVPQQTFIARSERVKDVLQTISSNNSPHEYIYKHEVLEILKNATISGGNIETQNRHISNIRNMLGTDRIFD